MLGISDEFCYIRIKFMFSVIMKNAVKSVSEQALIAFNIHCITTCTFIFNLKLNLNFSIIWLSSILRCGSEICGVWGFKEMDQLHIKFYKVLLRIKP